MEGTIGGQGPRIDWRAPVRQSFNILVVPRRTTWSVTWTVGCVWGRSHLILHDTLWHSIPPFAVLSHEPQVLGVHMRLKE